MKAGTGLRRFFGLTYAIMLLSAGTMIVLRLPGGSTTPGTSQPPPLSLALLLLYGFGPSIAGVVMTAVLDGRRGLRELWRSATRFNLGWQSYLVIVLLPLLALGLRVAVYLLRGGVTHTSALVTSLPALLLFTIQIAILGPISEEFGWRGFALGRLLDRWQPLAASLILGIIWAFWHLPTFFIAGTAQALSGSPLIEFPLFALTTIGTSVIFTWLYLRSGRSLWSALLFHFTINFCVSYWVTLANDGLPGRITWAVIILITAAIMAFSWRRVPEATPAAA